MSTELKYARIFSLIIDFIIAILLSVVGYVLFLIRGFYKSKDGSYSTLGMKLFGLVYISKKNKEITAKHIIINNTLNALIFIFTISVFILLVYSIYQGFIVASKIPDLNNLFNILLITLRNFLLKDFRGSVLIMAISLYVFVLFKKYDFDSKYEIRVEKNILENTPKYEKPNINDSIKDIIFSRVKNLISVISEFNNFLADKVNLFLSNNNLNYFTLSGKIVLVLEILSITVLLLITKPEKSKYEFIEPTFRGYPCLDDCTGHEKGYEWAREKGIHNPDNCGGNSKSFTEGCQIYARGF